MTSVLRIKQDGVWRGPVADGIIKVRKGSAWASPAIIRVKRGGSWVDTGYRGYPNPPRNLSINAWSFSTISVRWDAPAAGGGLVESYDIQMRESNGSTVIETKSGDTASPSANFAVGEDWAVAFFVRSVSSNGLKSAWVQGNSTGDGRLWSRAVIGHTETGYYQNENRTRPWSSEHLSGYRNKDGYFAVGIPSSVVLTGMHWRNLGTPQSGVVTPTASRTIWWVFNDNDWSPINDNLGTVATGNSTDWGFNNQGDGRTWGIVARGSGWSTSGNPYFMYYVDDFWCDGTETYQVSVYYQTRAYAGNNYW